ncbi:MAG: chromosomal replication initiator protein DnaA [Tannerella sp.]|jgi:chromosomal replication initiator protein|nr:chromosomal replication initiator protein DnaA [Tannerella sp.]
MMHSDHQSLWNKCLTIVKDIVPEAAFNTWFKPIIPLSYEEKKMTIQVPSQFFYEYLEEKYIHVLKTTLHRVFGEETILNYRVVVGQQADASPKKNSLPSAVRKEMPEWDPHLISRYTFDNFYEGSSNKLARTAGIAIAENPGGTSFNPLFLYGPSGVGKTHMVHAIGMRIRELFPQKKVLYVSTHLFRIQYTDAVQKNTTNDFLKFYQSLDVLILDDVQELIGMDKTQLAFFHIFNHLHQIGKQLIITSDKAPVNMQGFEERLITRFKWGLNALIDRPDRELRKTIINKKIEHEGLVVGKDVFDFIVDHVTENVRDLEGVLISLTANSLINNKKIDLALAQKVVGQMVSIERRKINVEKILKTVCKYYNVEPALLQSASRRREIVVARQVAMYLTKQFTDASLAHIGKLIGGKDHATVLHSVNTVKEQMEINKKFRMEVEAIEELLKNG